MKDFVIDRVDDPAKGISLARLLPKLLSNDGMRGIGPLDLTADEFLRGLICRGDRRFVMFQIMLDPLVVMAERDAPGAISKLTCEGEVRLEVHRRHHYNPAKFGN